MSTDKFHLNEAKPGHDARSEAMIRRGYGDLLNVHQSGRQEITFDTASMYKKAAEPGAMLGAGLGAMAGGVGGAELTEALGGSATAKLLGAMAGAGLGGVGGYYAGKQLDKADMDTGESWMDMNLHRASSGAGAALGALAGYGTSKYLVGSKNKTHHVLSALLGAGIGAGAGYLGAGGAEWARAFDEGMAAATKYDLSPEKAREFAKVYASKSVEGKNKARLWMLDYDRDRTFLSNFFQNVEDDAEKYAYNHIHGLPQTTTNWWSTGITGTVGSAIALPTARKVRNLLHKGFQTKRYKYEKLVDTFRDATKLDDQIAALENLDNWYSQTRVHVSNRTLKEIHEVLLNVLKKGGVYKYRDAAKRIPALIGLLDTYNATGRFSGVRRFGRGLLSLLRALF